MDWTRYQTLSALELYFRTRFGRLHSKNPDIIDLAQQIGRTPGAVARKLCNLASRDPNLASRGIKGLTHCSKLDRELFDLFLTDPEQVLEEIARSGISIAPPSEESQAVSDTFPIGMDVLMQAKARRGQTFFRQALYSNYGGTCMISGLRTPALLTASHIIPWSKDKSRRCDPRNGLLLSALHDRAFDKGYLTISEKFEVIVSPALVSDSASEFAKASLFAFAGQPLNLPKHLKFGPCSDALAYHREHVFKAA